MEAMQKLKDGQKFNEVAAAYSEDKARQGVSEWRRCSEIRICSVELFIVCPVVVWYLDLAWGLSGNLGQV